MSRVVRSALSSLKTIPANQLDYTEMRLFETQNNCLWLGQFDHAIHYIPNSTTDKKVFDALNVAMSIDFDERLVRTNLFQLWCVSKHAKISDSDRDVTIATFVDVLRGYPTDVCVSVINSLMHTQEFWPSMAELSKQLGEHAGPLNYFHGSIKLLQKRRLKNGS